MRFDLFYTPDCEEFKEIVAKKLHEVYGVAVVDRGVMDVYEGAYNIKRMQYDAQGLLDYLVRSMMSEHALWIVDQDMYYDNLNFVMGLAMYHLAGVVSTYRLDSQKMVAKECVHEAGHVLGLDHCKNSCVMRFSNSIEDAENKPDMLCERCRDILNRKIVEAGPLF
jgi:archaemetzincin